MKLRKKRSISFFLLTFFVVVNSFSNDSISTKYAKGEFNTFCKVWVKAPENVAKSVVTDFVYQTKYNLDELFTWALKDMKLKSEKNDLLEFDFKKSIYNEKTGLVRGVGDVVVPYIVTFPDIKVDSRLNYVDLRDGRSRVIIEVLYSDAFFKKSIGYFYLIPSENGCWMTLETKVKFGWFFDIFITLNKYTEIMEWRFEKLIRNLKDEAEKRAHS